MYVKWDASYSTGIDLYDEQHKRLFQMINDLHDGIRAKKGRDALGEALSGLEEYTKTHFGAEEKVMSATSYPGFANHKKQHDDFVSQIRDVRFRHDNNEPVMSVELIGFLVQWLKDHIFKVDHEYGPHLKGNWKF